MTKDSLAALIVVSVSTSAAQDLVRIPAARYDVTDQITSVKLQISVSEFLMGATEVTQRDYEAITNSNPSIYKGPARPVENVSWWDAIRYCNLRSASEGFPPCYDLSTGRRNTPCTGYRLPTEAEWTVAAGSAPGEEQIRGVANLGSSSTKTISVLEELMKNGTAPVRSFKPNELSIFDMRGNVWEWSGDYFSVLSSPDATKDPSGPKYGLERLIRGGSFASTTSRWSRGYRSSMNPDSRSRFTGFRIVRSQNTGVANNSKTPVPRHDPAPKGFESAIGPLTPLAAPGVSPDDWKQSAMKIRAKWQTLLAEPKLPAGKPVSRLIREVPQRNFAGQMFELETEPGIWEKIYVLRPSNTGASLRPVIIVPFYDVDTPAAADLAGRNYAPDRGVNAFAYTAAQHGYIAVAVRWFGESYGESSSDASFRTTGRNWLC